MAPGSGQHSSLHNKGLSCCLQWMALENPQGGAQRLWLAQGKLQDLCGCNVAALVRLLCKWRSMDPDPYYVDRQRLDSLVEETFGKSAPVEW